MTKSELVQILALQYPDLSLKTLDETVDVILDEISSALLSGKRVELRGFGTFSVRKRDARIGRNPRTGAEVKVQAKAVPFFKPGKQLRDRLNESVAHHRLAA